MDGLNPLTIAHALAFEVGRIVLWVLSLGRVWIPERTGGRAALAGAVGFWIVVGLSVSAIIGVRVLAAPQSQSELEQYASNLALVGIGLQEVRTKLEKEGFVCDYDLSRSLDFRTECRKEIKGFSCSTRLLVSVSAEKAAGPTFHVRSQFSSDCS